MSNNTTEPKEVLKKCPILKDWCTKEAKANCAFATPMFSGGRQTGFVCAVEALLVMISQLNTKIGVTPIPVGQQDITRLFRG